MDVQDLESPILIPSSYPPSPPQLNERVDSTVTASSTIPPTRSSRLVFSAIAAVSLLGLVSLFYHGGGGARRELQFDRVLQTPVDRWTASRGPAEGVSEKSNGPILGATPAYSWTNAMLVWQRTAYHLQPHKNWMSDPDGPLYYKGWYHIFYQCNPGSALWGNISWGHAVSRDLIHWLFLPLAMVPDCWYDTKGVFGGSATLLPDGRIAMVYTGATPESVQVQNLAFPADPDDPLLINWNKSESNPVLLPPNWIGKTDFRDPTTAWYLPSESAWRLTIGSKDADQNGVALVYQTKDFITYELLPDFLHLVSGTGMWECLDFYPVSTGSSVGLDTSTGPGPGVKHVLKTSLDDGKHDFYAIGTYDGEGTWMPDEPEIDVGIGLRYDYGKFYASKTFYDPVKERRVLWGWIGESGKERIDPLKVGASLQSIPRTVTYDAKTKRNLLLWPIDEVESLRSSSQEFSNIKLSAGSVVPLNVTKATQVDIEAEFEIDSSAVERALEADIGYNCSTSGGAAGRGALGPFGLLVLADQESTEQTAVYFYLGRGTDGGITTYFCQDELRSSLASDLIPKAVYGSSVPVLDGERLTMRTLVDQTVVESFAQGGRTCITSRLYLTKANHGEARVILFNNSTGAPVTAKSLKIWEMDSALIHPYSAQTEAL